MDDSKRTAGDAVLSLVDGTPEPGGFDLVKFIFNQISGFFKRRKPESGFLKERNKLFSDYEAKMEDVEFRIGIERDILSDHENALMEIE